MLMEVKNQLKVSFLTIKYVIFMVLNNASFIIQWIVLYSLRSDIGGYTFKQVLLLWGMASGTYGLLTSFLEKHLVYLILLIMVNLTLS